MEIQNKSRLIRRWRTSDISRFLYVSKYFWYYFVHVLSNVINGMPKAEKI